MRSVVYKCRVHELTGRRVCALAGQNVIKLIMPTWELRTDAERFLRVVDNPGYESDDVQRRRFSPDWKDWEHVVAN